MKIFHFFALFLLANVAALANEETPDPSRWIETDKVILRGLDKVSARVFTSEVHLNQKVHFGSLEIYVRSASRSPPEDKPDSACFLEIFDNKQGQQRQKVFSGWMFSSNPALAALEHPVYDIWIQEAVIHSAEEQANAMPTAITPAEASEVEAGD
ncbi:MAG: DUF2155 domain-containing protein [Alphaproteobacteria bacterium]|nr:DUF2155 domain-containing protein [Alphaproteobacteria bacterium]